MSPLASLRPAATAAVGTSPTRRALRLAAAASAAGLLAGCYRVDSFVDAVDAHPGDGVCARALTAAERSAGLRPPSAAAWARLRAPFAQLEGRLDDAGRARLAAGDARDLGPTAQDAARAAARAALASAAPAPRPDTPPVPPGRPGGVVIEPPTLCTLRAAIMEANAHPWKSVITVPAGTYRLTLPAAAGGGSLKPTANMRLQGEDAGTTIVDANAQSNVVYINGPSDLEINHMTLRGAVGTSGGVRIDAARVEMEDVVVRDNRMGSQGGGLYVHSNARLVLRRATVQGNVAAFGGGLINHGEAWVYDSTIHGNEGNRGGGVMNQGQINLRNVTISGNWVDSPVAGVGGMHQGGFAVLNNVTITNNQGIGNAAHSWQGGGIQTATGATTVLRNSIVAGNDGTNGPHDCAGEAFTPDSGHNLIGDSLGCSFSGSTATWVLDEPAELGTLAYNGGPTMTHMPASDSPARDAAYAFPPPAAPACEARDQRGVPRPQGAGACDMGAVEYSPTSIAVSGFMLVDAATNADIRPLRNDDWLVLSQLPAQLSIRALASGSTGSVVFGFGGDPAWRTENVAPFALGGDANGDYAPVPLTGGAHTLSATPYQNDNGGGAAGPGREIRFNVLAVN